MGWRFRKSFKKGPLNINLSKSGLGGSIGIPGFRVGVSATGQYYLSVGIPNSGFYWVKNFGKHRDESEPQKPVAPKKSKNKLSPEVKH
jgi:hypothetical protein